MKSFEILKGSNAVETLYFTFDGEIEVAELLKTERGKNVVNAEIAKCVTTKDFEKAAALASGVGSLRCKRTRLFTKASQPEKIQVLSAYVDGLSGNWHNFEQLNPQTESEVNG